MFLRLGILMRLHKGIILILAIFVTLTSLMAGLLSQGKMFNSPDTVVNYYFASRFAEQSTIAMPVWNIQAKEFLAPRSTRVIGDKIVPAGFLGLIIIYGTIQKFIWFDILPYLTILAAALGMLYFYLLIRKIFNNQVAWWSVLLMSIHPAWIYYSSHSLFPNVLFLSLILAAFYYWYQMSQRTRTVDFFLAGLLTALALFVRTSEWLWVGLAIILYLIIQRQTVILFKLIWSVVGAGIVLLVGLGLNYLLYGGSLTMGYHLTSLSPSGSTNFWLNLLLPFGFHPLTMMHQGLEYLLIIFWPFTVFVLMGLVILRRHFYLGRHYFYWLIWVGASLWLWVYYGSWLIKDSPDPRWITLGTAYVRYFLPVYIFSLPFAAWLIISSCIDWLPRQRKIWLTFIAVVLTAFSFKLVILDPNEGFLAERNILQQYSEVSNEVWTITNGQGIVVTPKGDKYLWPKQNIMVYLEDADHLKAIQTFMAQKIPVYYLYLPVNPNERLRLDNLWQAYGYRLGVELFSVNDLAFYQLENND